MMFIDFIEDLFFDSALSYNYNRVMPLFEDESLLVCKYILKGRYKNVLDLGSGSGVFSIIASNHCEYTVGIDINPRAVEYALQNSKNSNAEDKCHFFIGDLYKPVQNQTFDLIVSNPPFVPLPFGYKMFLSADGGPDGLNLVKRILNGVHHHLSKNGKLILLTLSLGNSNHPLVFRYLHKAFENKDCSIMTTHLYEKESINAEPFFSLFKEVNNYNEWREYLNKRELTNFYYMIHEIEPNGRFEHIQQMNKIPFKKEEFSGSWEGRLNRFRTWFKLKKKFIQ